MSCNYCGSVTASGCNYCQTVWPTSPAAEQEALRSRELSLNIKEAALNAKDKALKEERSGMTKRELFAMHAMQGLIGSNVHKYDGGIVQEIGADNLAVWARAQADALIKELEETK